MITDSRGSDTVAIATAVLEWAPNHCPLLWWGEGRKDGSCFVGIRHNEVKLYPFAMWTYGRIQVQFQMLRQRGVASDALESLRIALSAVPGIQMQPDAVNKFPSFEIGLLKQPQALARFFDLMESVIGQIQAMPNVVSVAAGSD